MIKLWTEKSTDRLSSSGEFGSIRQIRVGRFNHAPANVGQQPSPLRISFLHSSRPVGEERADFEGDAFVLPPKINLNVFVPGYKDAMVLDPAAESRRVQPTGDLSFKPTPMADSIASCVEQFEQTGPSLDGRGRQPTNQVEHALDGEEPMRQAVVESVFHRVESKEAREKKQGGLWRGNSNGHPSATR